MFRKAMFSGEWLRCKLIPVVELQRGHGLWVTRVTNAPPGHPRNIRGRVEILLTENWCKDTTAKEQFDQLNFILFIINVLCETNLQIYFISLG